MTTCDSVDLRSIHIRDVVVMAVSLELAVYAYTCGLTVRPQASMRRLCNICILNVNLLNKSCIMQINYAYCGLHVRTCTGLHIRQVQYIII